MWFDFAVCMLGPGEYSPVPECAFHNYDGDSDVDLQDFAALSNGASQGPPTLEQLCLWQKKLEDWTAVCE